MNTTPGPVRSVYGQPVIFLSGRTPLVSTKALIALGLMEHNVKATYTNNQFEATHIIVTWPKDAIQFTSMINTFDPEQKVICLNNGEKAGLPSNVVAVSIHGGVQKLAEEILTLPTAA